MPTHLLIGAGAGLVSAALFASAATAAALAGILLYLSPLPLCLAGLGWGRSAAALAGLTGTVVMAVTLGPGPALAFALTIAAPVAVFTHLLLLSRPIPAAEGATTPTVEWYPPGRLVGWAALIAGILAALLVLALGPGLESYHQWINQTLFPNVMKVLGPNASELTPKMIDSLKAVLAKALPAAFVIVWLALMLLNLWLAGLIVEASGRALRPWPDLHSLEVPNVFVAVFAGALIVSFVPGVIGLLATGLASAMLFAYMLQGLAVIHVYSRGVPLRWLLLVVVYLGILFLGWLAIVVAIVGLAEPLFGWRGRNAAPGNQSQGNDETD
jgi:uncharacterized protein YybS (DUF2232 family)